MGEKPVKIFVQEKGKITHKTGETKFRPATKTKRGKIAEHYIKV